MAELAVRNLSKSYGTVLAVDDVSFTVRDGEFLTLLGPSGCGKSTTLAAVAGLETPSAGRIEVGGTALFDGTAGLNLPAEARNLGLVFQSYALWPHLTVRENVAFPLKLRKLPKRERETRIDAVLAMVEMTPYADRYPHQLSGGQQQRVALARTLVYEPAVLLLDEPLSNLDAKLRERARAWLDNIKQQVRLTTLYVTHDQVEALVLSDRIAVMNGGKIVQLGTPREIYESPSDPFIADFIGTSSFFRGNMKTVAAGAENAIVLLADGSEIAVVLKRDFKAGSAVIAALRPEKLRVVSSPENRPSGSGTLIAARIRLRSYLGARWQYDLDVAGEHVKVESPVEIDRTDLWLWIPTEACLVFAAA